MKPTSLFLVVLLLALVNDVAAFLAPTPSTCKVRAAASAPLFIAKKPKDEDLLINKKNKTWKDYLKLAITGSPDGISMIGKPQYDWGTGKVVAKRKHFDWNASSQSKAAKKDAKKK